MHLFLDLISDLGSPILVKKKTTCSPGPQILTTTYPHLKLHHNRHHHFHKVSLKYKHDKMTDSQVQEFYRNL